MSEQPQLYSADIVVAATAYVKARSESEARQILVDATKDYTVINAEGADCEEIPITGSQFDDPDLPVVSMSPIMTVQGTTLKTPVELCN
ncbi:hypothetical protein MUG78_17595 [Gordonia alkaliphila]|uniref:hypothetical protein n=1 Tax=Gordonia alkaliphila TaxID=1053547 RepID=UPI001FF2EDF6|nr:hypothetical protein [Gordonia alkaliphila]MCK0441216.1 hypothetical protein [Gordonia alkaliphila]